MAGYIGTKAVALSTTTGTILGDMTVGGTTDVATLEFNSLSGTGAVTITDILDEDNLASNSATKLATQQSIKAYVDAQVDTVDTLAEILAIGNRTAGAGKIEFRDAAIFINSSTNGQLDLVADTEIQIAATTIDVNGNLDVSGTTVSAGNLLVGRTGNLAGARTLVAGTKSGTNGTNGQLVVLDEQGFGTTDNGGGLSFAGNFYNGGQVVFSTVQGVKENNTDANNAGALKFTTKAHGGNQVEAMRISSGGNVTVSAGNLIVGTAGKGIDFAATGDGAGTDTSELLNDYEEGTFTPLLTVNDSLTGITQNISLGRYIKVGRHVTAWLHLRLTAKGSASGHVRIQGFPYAASNLDTTDEAAAGTCAFWNALASAATPGGYMQKGTTKLLLINNAAGTASPSLGHGALSNTTSFYYQVCYNTVAVS